MGLLSSISKGSNHRVITIFYEPAAALTLNGSYAPHYQPFRQGEVKPESGHSPAALQQW